jgi:MinD-like ATPase involved in chromosome partitioning or flagellar assembly
MKNKTFFGQVLPKTLEILASLSFASGIVPLVVRDIYGRIRIALPALRSECEDIATSLQEGMKGLGVFADQNKAVLFEDDFFNPDDVFQSPDILDFVLPGGDASMRFLDRQLIGQDWLQPEIKSSQEVPRLVFFGLKGGVGRSTALAILAYTLAKSGKRILLIDFDLESPGISNLLLPSDRLTDFGLVDWFVEDTVGQGEDVLQRMVSVSPLSDHTPGEIRIAAAMGANDSYYVDKLSRVYSDVNIEGRVERFSDRSRRLLEKLEEQERPDVILIDSRAGLHDIAAVSIVGLSTSTFLFACDSAQTWEGYKLLFSHWQAYPTVLRAIRDRLSMVQALFPEIDQVARAERFVENAYTVFSETIYEKIEAGKEPDPEVFNFDLEDTSAPHYPWRIKWNSRFQEFDPLLIPLGILSDADIVASFGDFLDGVERIIEGNKL